MRRHHRLPLPPDGFRWLHDEVRDDLWIASVSGGTDVCSCFAGAVPTLPVYTGELQAPGLGTDLQSWDPAGRPLVDEVGELVVTNPMPSMPVRFWNDPDGSRYHDSYFDTYPASGATATGSPSPHAAPSSSTAAPTPPSTARRPHGSADIYEVVERLPEVKESLVIGIEQPDGGYWMPLFVHLAPGAVLDDALLGRIKQAIREQLSPRHVPDEVIEVPGVPHTLTGKRIEVPVKRLLQGTPLEKAVNPAPSTTSISSPSTRTSPASAPDRNPRRPPHRPRTPPHQGEHRGRHRSGPRCQCRRLL